MTRWPRRSASAALGAGVIMLLVIAGGVEPPSAMAADTLRATLRAATKGPRPPDPNATCLSSPDRIVELPPAQARLAPERGWRLSRGAGITVAVVDSGVDRSTPQLGDRVEPGVDVAVPGSYSGDADCLGHGTAMAALVAAAPFPGVGFHGVAPDATILPVRAVLNDLSPTADLLAAGVRAAVKGKARVILIAVSAAPSPPEIEADLRAALAEAATANVLVVAAAEVPATGSGAYALPASDPSVLAVAGVDLDGSAMLQESDAPPIVDISAPGNGVISAIPGGGHSGAYSGSQPAAAYVAGVAALVRAEFPRLTAAQVRSRLELTADRPGTQAPDPLLGWGAVNVTAALSAIIPGETLRTPTTTAATSMPTVAPPRAAAADDTAAAGRSLWIAGAGAAVAVATAVAVVVIPRGRRRGWRATRSVPKTSAWNR